MSTAGLADQRASIRRQVNVYGESLGIVEIDWRMREVGSSSNVPQAAAMTVLRCILRGLGAPATEGPGTGGGDAV